MTSPSELQRMDEPCDVCGGTGTTSPKDHPWSKDFQCLSCFGHGTKLRWQDVGEAYLNAAELVRLNRELLRERSLSASLADRLAAASSALGQTAVAWEQHPRTVELRAERDRLRDVIARLGEMCGDAIVSDGDTSCTLAQWCRETLKGGTDV